MPLVASGVTVYPRVCGGTLLADLIDVRLSGLSPRVRGNPDSTLREHVRQWSIPACAGEPASPRCAALPRWVYPRVCGGTTGTTTPMPPSRGLSPRVRGNLVKALEFVEPLGSIPACAGEPYSGGAPRGVTEVYPRVCGGTMLVNKGEPLVYGLSPRVRGNRQRPTGSHRNRRSIPACAGEPRRVRRRTGRRTVYPRVCGGTVTSAATPTAADGLSPRVRGNHVDRTSEQSERRSIPACAGEPRTFPASWWRRPVYPRVCGGTPDEEVTIDANLGLSPRVRGNHLPQALASVGLRSIPACAGEPRSRR